MAEAKGFYRGRRLEDMSREELIEAILDLANYYRRGAELHLGDMRVLCGMPREEHAPAKLDPMRPQ